MTYREEWKDFIKRELITSSFKTESELKECYEKAFEVNKSVVEILIGYEFTVTEILILVKAILPDKNLIRQNVLREYKNFIIEVGVRRKEGVKSQKTYKYKK